MATNYSVSATTQCCAYTLCIHACIQVCVHTMCIHCAYTRADRQVHGQTHAYTPYMGASDTGCGVSCVGLAGYVKTPAHVNTCHDCDRHRASHVAPGPPGRSQNAAVVMLATATVHKRWTLPPQSHDACAYAAVCCVVCRCAALYVCMHCMYVYGVNTLCQAPPP